MPVCAVKAREGGTFLSSSVGSKKAHFELIFSESHWGPYPKDTGP